MALTAPQVLQLDQLKEEVAENSHFQQIIRELQAEPSSRPGYSLVDGQLLFKGRLLLRPGSTLIPLLMKEGHDGQIGGHSGFLRTYKRLAANVYWVGMKKDIH